MEVPFGITLGWVPILLIWMPLTVWLLRRVGREMTPGLGKWTKLTLAALLMAAIPLGDDAYIQWQFNRLCRDAGLHYEKKIEVEGFYDDTTNLFGAPGPINSPQAIESFERLRFRFFESKAAGDPGRHTHIEKVDGKWQVTILDRSTARYHYRNSRQHERIGFRLQVQEYVIVDSQSSNVVARKSIYTRYPGWLDSVWLRFFDQTGKQCPPGGGASLRDVLIPVDKP